jgi:hypothetical protein
MIGQFGDKPVVAKRMIPGSLRQKRKKMISETEGKLCRKSGRI